MSGPAVTPVFLVDDHPMVREGLAHLLRASGFVVAGEAGTSQETLAHPGLALAPLVIVDLSLGDESGVELIKRLRLRGLFVLVYSMYEGAHVIRRALDAGAGGYVTKREAAQSLVEAVQAVRSGSRYLSARAEAALHEQVPCAGLSGQQRQLYRLLGQGLSNEQIAAHLGISVRTLESYCARIMDKLGVQGIKELRRQAIRNAAASDPGAGVNV